MSTQIKNITFNNKTISTVKFKNTSYFQPNHTTTHSGSVSMTFYKAAGITALNVTTSTKNATITYSYFNTHAATATPNGTYHVDSNGAAVTTYKYVVYQISFTVNGMSFTRSNFSWGNVKNYAYINGVWIDATTNPTKTETASWTESTPIYKLYSNFT